MIPISTIIRFIIIPIITLFIAGVISCNSRQDTHGDNSTYAWNQPDSSQIKKLAANYIQGKHLFEKLCITCHIAPERRVTDQYIFDNLFERLPSPPEDYFIKYIQNSKSLKSSGDNYAMKIDEAWNSDYEHYFEDSLSRQDFYDLIIYVKVAAKQKYQ